MPQHDEPTATGMQNGHKPAMDAQSAIKAEMALAKALHDYAGEWVAVENHAVIDNASDLQTLVGRLNGQRETAVVFRVEPDSPAAYLR
jgi:hypothetical protein